MENMFLFLSFIFLFTLIFGMVIERFRIPWIFSALILGIVLSRINPFAGVMGYEPNSKMFEFLAQIGMYFLLFVIGFEIDLKEIKRSSRFILVSTFMIIVSEAILGTLLIYFIFNPLLSAEYGIVIAFLVALSFATVGEAVLIPILDEFGIINTKLGQTIIGIGCLDDIIEVFALIFMAILVGSQVHEHVNIAVTLLSLLILFIMTISITEFGEEGRKFCFRDIETLFLFVIFIFFLFLGIGEYAESTALAALLAGISMKTFLPERRLKLIESEVKTMCYGLFVPIFFVWVGMSIDIEYLLSYPLLILLVVFVSGGTKLIVTYIIGNKELGKKESILLGIGLSVRFSTGIVIIKILFENKLINEPLYSILIASTAIFTFVIPLLFANLLAKWKGIAQSRF